MFNKYQPYTCKVESCSSVVMNCAYAYNSSSTEGKDFSQVESGGVVFSPGSTQTTSASIHINILDDSSLEYDEFLSFSIVSTSSHAVCSGNGTIDIIENGDSMYYKMQ